ncbi:mechanosensitive ion channel domain-containing protein [Maridesulfovibrio sp.]|uniref:mechanosensitive ion channel family protein n=1 Tax=Maridesulfovibrio sp. TaxID=2795000 RepID=UPI0029F522E6|nr:mechanosensitive ion channel domain-containing protein [Maridesulfovibrio sp.]
MTKDINIGYMKYVSALFCAFLILTASLTAFANPDYEFLKNRVQNYQAFEAEELATYSVVEELIILSQKEYAKLLQRSKIIIFSERASANSPIERKFVKNTLNDLKDDIQGIVIKLGNAKAECLSRIEVLKSFEQLSSSMPDGTPEDLKALYRERSKSVYELRMKSMKQLSRIDLLHSQGIRMLDRIEKIESGEKQNLFELWKAYLLTGRAPVFSSEFWNASFPVQNWVQLRTSEIISAIQEYNNNWIKHLSVFIVVTFSAFFIKNLIRKHLTWRYSILHEHRKIKIYSLVALISISLCIANVIVFPTTMELPLYLYFCIFFYSILRLSKYISRDKFLITSGSFRLSMLFFLSVSMLALHVPSQVITVFIVCFTVVAWSLSSITAWRRNRFKGLLRTAGKTGVMTPLVLLAFLGFGRLACLAAILWCLGVFIRSFGRLWGQILFVSTEKGEKLLKGLISGLAVPLGWGISFSIVYYWLSTFFGPTAMDDVMERKITIYGFALTVESMVSLAVLFFITKSCVAAFNVSIEHVGGKWPRGKRGAIPSMQTLFTYSVWSLFVIISMRVLGVNLTSIAVIAGGLSVGIGFGLQNIVNNFISGLILLFGRSIQQGDVIELAGLWCTVQKINIRTTVVETFENAVIMIPNSDLVTTQMTNWTKNSSTLRRDIVVGVAYGSDIEKVKQTLLAVAGNAEHVLNVPEPFVVFSNFGSSSLDFILRIWIDDIDYSIRALSDLRFEIDNNFRKEGIEIAFPQMDVHVKNFPASKHIKDKSE